MGKGKRNRLFRNHIGIKARYIPKRPDRAHRTPAEVEELVRSHALAQAHQGPARQERPLGKRA